MYRIWCLIIKFKQTFLYQSAVRSRVTGGRLTLTRWARPPYSSPSNCPPPWPDLTSGSRADASPSLGESGRRKAVSRAAPAPPAPCGTRPTDTGRAPHSHLASAAAGAAPHPATRPTDHRRAPHPHPASAVARAGYFMLSYIIIIDQHTIIWYSCNGFVWSIQFIKKRNYLKSVAIMNVQRREYLQFVYCVFSKGRPRIRYPYERSFMWVTLQCEL